MRQGFEPPSRSPPKAGAVKSLFRAAGKAINRLAENEDAPKQRRRKGETGGQFRIVARRFGRRLINLQQSFRRRAGIAGRFIIIPPHIAAVATANDTLRIAAGDDFDNGFTLDECNNSKNTAIPPRI